MRRIRSLTLLVSAATTAAVLVTGAPPSVASPAPWDWMVVTSPFTVDPGADATGTAQCPADWVPISGGVAPNGGVGNGYEIERVNEYAQDGLVSGGRWHVAVHNLGTAARSLKVVLHCIPTSQLPATSYVSTALSMSGNYAEGRVTCPANTIAVAGGVDWDNFTSRTVNYSGATADGDSWYAIGWNSATTAHLYVEAYCLDANDLPGLQLAQLEYTNNGSVYDVKETVVTCPAGTRVLSGGTEVRFWGGSAPGKAFTSWPVLNSWHVTSYGHTLADVYLRAWCVPAGSPTITVEAPGPEGMQTQAQDALFRLSGADPAGSAVTFHCALDDDAATTCPTSVYFSSLADGKHTFVAYTETLDKRTSNIASYTWKVDTAAPTVSLKALKRVTLGATARQEWTGSDEVSGVASYDVRYRTATYDGPLGDWQEPVTWANLTTTSVSQPLALGDTVCFSVRATDQAGNESDWSVQKCTARPLDDRALTGPSTAWKQLTDKKFWLKTATRTTTHHARLSRTGAVLDRVGIVATRCSTCGKVAIIVDAVKIGTIDLHRSTTKNRAVLLLPVTTASAGTVVIKVLSTAKRVTIDGLVVTKSA